MSTPAGADSAPPPHDRQGERKRVFSQNISEARVKLGMQVGNGDESRRQAVVQNQLHNRGVVSKPSKNYIAAQVAPP